MDNTSKVANSWYSFGPRNIHDAAKKFMEIYKAPAQFDPELASIVSSSTTPQISSLTTQEAYMQVSEGSSTFDVGNSLNPAISLHVLVVDDNEINLKVSQDFLQSPLASSDRCYVLDHVLIHAQNRLPLRDGFERTDSP
jgi:hypothetical protein